MCWECAAVDPVVPLYLVPAQVFDNMHAAADWFAAKWSTIMGEPALGPLSVEDVRAVADDLLQDLIHEQQLTQQQFPEHFPVGRYRMEGQPASPINRRFNYKEFTRTIRPMHLLGGDQLHERARLLLIGDYGTAREVFRWSSNYDGHWSHTVCVHLYLQQEVG